MSQAKQIDDFESKYLIWENRLLSDFNFGHKFQVLHFFVSSADPLITRHIE